MDHAAALHSHALVIDTLAGGPGVYSQAMLAELEVITTTESTADIFREIERMYTREYRAERFPEYWEAVRQAGVDVLSVSIGAWGDKPFSFRGAVHDLGEWHQRFNSAGPGRFMLIREPSDLQATKDATRTGILLGFQDCNQLEGDLRNAETFHGLGVRIIQLSYNGPSHAGYGCTSKQDLGLTGFGRELIRCMNDLGLIIDLSHCGPRTTIEAIAHSRAPIAVSHSACTALHSHARNKSDDVLRALADTGGYFGVCAVPAFLAGRDQRPSLNHMIRHILHALDICGPERVGIGTDWGAAAHRNRYDADCKSKRPNAASGSKTTLTSGYKPRALKFGPLGTRGSPESWWKPDSPMPAFTASSAGTSNSFTARYTTWQRRDRPEYVHEAQPSAPTPGRGPRSPS